MLCTGSLPVLCGECGRWSGCYVRVVYLYCAGSAVGGQGVMYG